MNLKETQQLFWRAARREATPHELGRCFVSTPTFSAQRRAEVYAGAFFVRQRNALKELLPKTHEFLGADFAGLAHRYTLAHPGRHAALEHFTNGFGTFLSKVPGYQQAAALAQLEVARNLALRAPADPGAPLTPAGIQTLACDSTLSVSKSAHLVATDGRTLQLFSARSHSIFSLSSSAALWVLFFRKKFSVHHRSLSDDEARAIERLHPGATLSQLCETFLGHENPSRRAHAVISALLKDQILILLPPSVSMQ